MVDVDVSDDAVVADITDDAVAGTLGDQEDEEAGFFDAALYDSSEVPSVAAVGGEGADEDDQGAGLFDADGGWAEEPETVFSFEDEPSGQVELPHWTEPGTGELPRVLAGDDAPVSGSTPAVHWRGADAAWGDSGFDDLADISDEVRVGALDLDRPTDDDIYSFDELDPEPEPEPIGPTGGRRQPPPRPSVEQGPPSSGGAGRNLPVAIGVGLAFAAVALIAFAVGPAAAVVLVAVILCHGHRGVPERGPAGRVPPGRAVRHRGHRLLPVRRLLEGHRGLPAAHRADRGGRTGLAPRRRRRRRPGGRERRRHPARRASGSAGSGRSRRCS